MRYGEIYETAHHYNIEDSSELYIGYIDICIEGIQQVGNSRTTSNSNGDQIKNATVMWTHWTIPGITCKFRTKYFLDGRLEISPDVMEIDFVPDMGFIHLPPGDKLPRSGYWVEARRDSEEWTRMDSAAKDANDQYMQTRYSVTSIPAEDFTGPAQTYYVQKGIIASTSTFVSIPELSFKTYGILSMALMKEMTQVAILDIVGNISYANKEIGSLIFPPNNLYSETNPAEWSITPAPNGFRINGVDIEFKNEQIPTSIQIWNTYSNSSAKLFDLKKKGVLYDESWSINEKWSSKESMHPYQRHALVIPIGDTVSKDIQLNSKHKFVEWNMA